MILWWIKLTWLTAINHLLASDIQTGENQLSQFNIWPYILPALKHFHLSKLLSSPQLRFLQNRHLLDCQICRMSLQRAQKVVITRRTMIHQTEILGKLSGDQVMFQYPPKGMVETKITKIFFPRGEGCRKLDKFMTVDTRKRFRPSLCITAVSDIQNCPSHVFSIPLVFCWIKQG